jgi:hypothetical protein
VSDASVVGMPSPLHETLVEMFRDRPSLAAQVLADAFGTVLPQFKGTTLSSGDLSDVAPTEYRADLVVTLDGESGPVWAVVVEIQLRADIRKQRTWPAYVATLHARLGCPVALLVVCPEAAVAARCARPIAVGYPDFVLTPLVLGPDQVPVVTDAGQARAQPELTVLSALAHGGRNDRAPILEALLTALNVIDHEHANLYADVVLAALPPAARAHLEALMTSARTHGYQSDFARRYYAEGEADGESRGESRAVLAVLEARGVEVPPDARERITGCTDRTVLAAWIRRAATAHRVEEVLGG